MHAHSRAIIGNNSVTPAHPAGEGLLSLSLSLSLPPVSSSSTLLPLALSAAFSGVSPGLLSRRGSLALSWRNSIPQAVQNGEGAHTLLAPAAQDEISFPPAPILCPVIVHVKQPETCICPVGSQRRFPFVPSPLYLDLSHSPSASRVPFSSSRRYPFRYFEIQITRTTDIIKRIHAKKKKSIAAD